MLVTGAAGLLGSAIVEAFADGYEVHASDRATLDLADTAAVARIVADLQPGVIVNCAAYNDVDGCEDHPVAALAINALGVRALAHAAREAGSTFVHYSSDFVFDGETSRPYVEDDPPSPRSVYASSKLLGEWFAADVPRHYVLRVESLFGPSPPGSRTRRGSLGTIVDRIRGGEVVPVFTDRTVSPSFTPDVASATRRLAETDAAPGLYHCVNRGMATWIEIAEEIARRLGVDLHVRPLTLETVTMKARRPRFCALSPARLAAAGILMPPWQDALGRYLTA